MVSHRKPLVKPANQKPIPSLSNRPPFRECHSQRCSRPLRLQSTANTPRPDRHTASKVPCSTRTDSSGRPAWDDRTQITYPRPGLEFFFSRPFRILKKKGQAGKKGKKGLAESEVTVKEQARDNAEPLRPVRWYSSVPDLMPLPSESSPRNVPAKATAKVGATGKKESFLEWYLDRYGVQKRRARGVASAQQAQQETCKSTGIVPLPKDEVKGLEKKPPVKRDLLANVQGKKGLAESEVTVKEEARDNAKPLRRVGWYSSVPDLMPLSSESSPRNVPAKATAKVGATGKESFLEWYLDRYGVQKRRARGAASAQQAKQETCKSKDIAPLPKDEVKGLEKKPPVKRDLLANVQVKELEKKAPVKRDILAYVQVKELEKKAPVKRDILANAQVKELEKKAPVKRDIMANVQWPQENSTNPGGSRLRRSLSMPNVIGADSMGELEASTTKKPAARPASANKENK